MGRRKRSYRQIDGILPLDKPVGISSNEALQQVKRLYKAQKAGHTGSLDPIASGLLLICMGEATKVSSFLLEADKHYHTLARFGVRTETGDAEGAVVEERPVGDYSDADIERALEGFRGEIQQIPPMYSALKHKGVRLYELARQGVEVERKPRTVQIHELRMLDRGPDSLSLEIRCSKGTYIRTLVEDIGEVLGCGAHVAALRRVGVGPYTEEDMISLEELNALAEQDRSALEARLRPIDSALAHWPAVSLDGELGYFVRSGQAVWVPGAPGSGMVRMYAEDGAFLGAGKILDDGRVAPKRLIKGA